MAPQTRLAQRVACPASRRPPAGVVGEEDARAEPLEELRFVDRDSEVPQRDLRVRVGERERARGDARLVVLARQRARRASLRQRRRS